MLPLPRLPGAKATTLFKNKKEATRPSPSVAHSGNWGSSEVGFTGEDTVPTTRGHWGNFRGWVGDKRLCPWRPAKVALAIFRHQWLPIEGLQKTRNRHWGSCLEYGHWLVSALSQEVSEAAFCMARPLSRAGGGKEFDDLRISTLLVGSTPLTIPLENQLGKKSYNFLSPVASKKNL